MTSAYPTDDEDITHCYLCRSLPVQIDRRLCIQCSRIFKSKKLHLNGVIHARAADECRRTGFPAGCLSREEVKQVRAFVRDTPKAELDQMLARLLREIDEDVSSRKRARPTF